MLLFHGTRGGRDRIRSIAREGLRAVDHAWTHDVLRSKDPTTFLSPTPVAGHGGDPVAFAMGFRSWSGPRTPGDGWIVVVDLPHEALASTVRAVIANRDLEQYFARWTVLSELASRAVGPRAVTVLELLEELGRRPDLAEVARGARPVLLSHRRDVDLRGVSFADWRAYATAIAAAPSLEAVARAGRRYGVRWAEPEVPHCDLCVSGMADWAYELPVRLACTGEAPPRLRAHVGARDLFGEGLVAHARMAARWYEGVDRREVAAGFERLAEASGHGPPGEALTRLTPLDPARLPAPWRPGFGRTWREEDLRGPDVQLVCDAIPPEHVVGALRLAAGPKLRPWARPTKAAPLAQRLWRGARALRAASSRPDTIYDGDG